MGRNRLDKTKKRITLSVDEQLWLELEKDGVNRSRLFSIIARKYLRKKSRNRKKQLK